MRVQLVLPDMGVGYTMNHGVTSVAAVVKRRGDECSLIHIDSEFTVDRIVGEIERWRPDVVGVCLTENHWLQMQALARGLKNRRNVPVFFGGPFPSAYPEGLVECEAVDGFCIGEGDVSFVEVLNRIDAGQDYHETKGFWFRAGGDIVKNERPPVVDNLDDLPLPHIRIHDMRAVKNYPAFSFSRGCPFKCTYCCAPLYQKWENGATVRYKSPARAIMEIKDLLELYDAPSLNFDDDTFFKSKKWLREFLDLYIREIRKPFACNTRPETVGDEIVSMLKEANCEYIFLGIESGDEQLREKVLGRGRTLTNKRTIEAFETIRRYGIRTFSFNMVGMPGETPEMHQRTIELNRRILPDRLQMTVFYPYRGTGLGDEAYRRGIVAGEGYPTYFGRTILSMPEFTKRQVERASRLFRYRVYKDVDLRKALYFYVLDGLMRYPLLFNTIFRLYRLVAGSRFAISRLFIRPRRVEADTTLWPTRRAGELGPDPVEDVSFAKFQGRSPGQAG